MAMTVNMAESLMIHGPYTVLVLLLVCREICLATTYPKVEAYFQGKVLSFGKILNIYFPCVTGNVVIFCRSDVSFTTEVQVRMLLLYKQLQQPGVMLLRKVDFTEKHDIDLLLVICHGHFSLGINKQQCLSC